MTLFVNLYGGPGSGKSATAYSVTGYLKSLGVNAEMTPEFAKFLVWDERTNTLDNQVYVTSKQYYMMSALTGKADVVITDSPVLLGIVYSAGYPDSWHSTIKWCNSQVSTPGLNFFLRRPHAFTMVGRKHDLEESRALDNDIKLLMLQESIDHTCLDLDLAVDSISREVLRRLHDAE